ncbi:carbon-nitrogen family hydrolase [Ectobacillus ponti]|uniref:Carbon-nitrogen family hydrolase n=1 Tax=Ectobacillus ponti TaxID=2961894 RepID=A0AA41XBV5_9BACI|nr:carbon-nitrogen family hydrolase [Ectobacillus ponti]MCP8970818.1 carbon-nitrogen family hydrolase [Ectobacillus ponti]
MKVACLQIDIAFGDIETNIETASRALAEAMKEQPDVVVLPELWTTGYDLTRLDVLADENGEKSRALLSGWAKGYAVNLVGGSIAKRTETGVTNTMYVYNRAGELVSEYSKAHLFQLMDEHKYLEAGSSEHSFELENVPCAGFICYDIRFPEWLRAHTSKGAQVLFVVAEWPQPRLAHWRTLLQARAIENQCFVVACNRAGNDPANVFAGHSLVLDPWGEVVAEAGEAPELLVAELDFAKVPEVRRGIPVFADRRPDLYQ